MSATRIQRGLEDLAVAFVPGDPWSQRGFIAWITPVIRARVTRAIVRGRRGRAAGAPQWDVEEITQEVLAMLFAKEARLLTSWDPERGLSLQNYVGLVAERRAVRLLRSRHRARWAEEPESCEREEVADLRPGPEAALAAREFMSVMLHRIHTELSPRGSELFELLLVEERSIDEVCTQTGLSRDAMYAWRSRLAKHARHVARQLERAELVRRVPSAPTVVSQREGMMP